MPLFQNSVLRSHLKNLNQTPIQKAYENYKANFLSKIENIKSLNLVMIVHLK